MQPYRDAGLEAAQLVNLSGIAGGLERVADMRHQMVELTQQLTSPAMV